MQLQYAELDGRRDWQDRGLRSVVRVPTDGNRTVQGRGGLSNCALSQTKQILNLGIKSSLLFALRIGPPFEVCLSPMEGLGVFPVQSFDVPSVSFRRVPLLNCLCLQCKDSVCSPFEVSVSPV